MTRQPTTVRLRNHVSEGRVRREHCHRVAWLRTVVESDLKPYMEVIDDGLDDVEAKFNERLLIATLRAMRCRLTNSTDGGDGGLSTVPEVRERFLTAVRSPEYRDKLRQRATGRKRPSVSAKLKARWAAASEERIEQVRELGRQWKGKKRSEASRLNMSESAKRRDASVYEKIATKNRGRKHTEEARAKMSTAHAGKPKPWASATCSQRNKDPEFQAKAAAGLRGKPKSAAHCEALSVAQKASWRRRKSGE